MSGVSRRRVLGSASAAVAVSMSGCTASGDGDGDGAAKEYDVEPMVVDSDDGLGCLESVSVQKDGPVGLWDRIVGFSQYSATITIAEDSGRGSVVVEWPDRGEWEQFGQVIDGGGGSVTIDTGSIRPEVLRVSVSCSGGEGVDAVFEVSE